MGGVGAAGDHEAHIEAEEAMDLPHPLGVAAGQVVVHRDDVHAVAREAVEVDRKGRHEGLSLARAHLGDPPEVERGATHQLLVVVTLPDDSTGGLAGDREGVDQDVVEIGALVELELELCRLGAKPFVGECLDLGFDRLQGAPLLALTCAQHLGKHGHRVQATDQPRRSGAARPALRRHHATLLGHSQRAPSLPGTSRSRWRTREDGLAL